MNRYLIQSSLIHLIFFASIALVTSWTSSRTKVIWLEGFDYMGGGGGGGGGQKSGIKEEHKGQVVPEPVKTKVPDKPAPVQKATKGEETWKVKDAKTTKVQPKKNIPENAVRGETTKEAKSNIIRRGQAENEPSGSGYDFGSGGGSGGGIGIGVGPGTGAGGFGFGSYLRIMRSRVWAEWNQSAVYGTKLSCVVGLTIATNGGVSDIKLVESSGNSFYDNVALRAIRNSSPLPPLPPKFPDPKVRINVKFQIQG